MLFIERVRLGSIGVFAVALCIMNDHYARLAELLRRRLHVIADHEFRDRDPNAHLAALRQASEALEEEYTSLRGSLPARLNHFMRQASYQKALAFIEGDDESLAGSAH